MLAIFAVFALLSCRDTCNRPFGGSINRFIGYFNTRLNREDALRYDLSELRKAINDYHVDQKRYPASLDDLVRSHYLRAVPHDPITESRRSWIEVRAVNGIYDVRSGATGKGCDGREYRKW
jgi:general secretion pathway protein G